MTTRALLLFLAISAGVPAPAAEFEPGGDLSRLQGRWDARVGPPGRSIRVELQLDGRRAEVNIKTPQGLSYRARGEIRLDEATSPRALDWSHFAGIDGQELPEIPAIYRIEGDRWTVCNGGPNGTRPGEFRPGDGLLADVVVFERAKDQPVGRDKSSGTLADPP